jgi:methanethiol S-methyltransferase
MMIDMLVGWTFVIIGILMVIQGWRELYRANKDGRLATGGIYSVVRHPQYTGILLALFGEGVVHWPTLLTVLLFPVIVLAYVLLAFKEEKRMGEQFGDQYREYQWRVPMFFPRFRGPKDQWRRLFREIHLARA